MTTAKPLKAIIRSETNCTILTETYLKYLISEINRFISMYRVKLENIDLFRTFAIASSQRKRKLVD